MIVLCWAVFDLCLCFMFCCSLVLLRLWSLCLRFDVVLTSGHHKVTELLCAGVICCSGVYVLGTWRGCL